MKKENYPPYRSHRETKPIELFWLE